MTSDPRTRLDELLATGATQKLTPAEEAELRALPPDFADADPEAFERAAAAVHLALAGPPEAMPAGLAERLYRAAGAAPPSSPKPEPRPARTGRVGWAIAAVLAWLLLYTNWPKPAEPTIAERRTQMLTDRSAKTATGEDAQAGRFAHVVWSTEKQEGYLEVRGLTPNDPTKEQYQLWIVDPARKQPVDGGVFDVRPDGTALVRVRSPIVVKTAQAFAITKEIAGGVVVSDGPHLLVLKPG